MLLAGVVVYSMLYMLWVPAARVAWPLYFAFPEPDVDGLAAHPVTHVGSCDGINTQPLIPLSQLPLVNRRGNPVLSRSTGFLVD